MQSMSSERMSYRPPLHDAGHRAAGGSGGANNLDTRTKILAVEEVLRETNGKPLLWVSGHFDPMLAEHAKRLRAMKTQGAELAVIIENPPNPFLSQRARAELIAALAVVDYVVLNGNGVAAASLNDLQLRDRFSEHIARRQSAEGEA